MRTPLKLLGLLLLGGILFTQFTNCDVYSDSSVFNGLSSDNCTSGGECFGQDANMLELATVNRLFVLSSQGVADLGGDCNEGGFPYSKITWEIKQNGTTVRTCNDVNTCGSCVNGRFQVQIVFTPLVPASDLQVVVEVEGFDVNLKKFSNPLIARKTIQVQTP